MVVRPLVDSDLPQLLRLLELQDVHAEFRTMAPESRNVHELALELGDESPYNDMLPLVVEQNGHLTAYLAVCNYNGEAFLEGPVLAEGVTQQAVSTLFETAIEAARSRGYAFVEAFVNEQNEVAQQVLEQAGFEAFRTTYMYEIRRADKRPPVPKTTAFRFAVGADIDVSTYRDLYRETSDNWANRLAWTDEELETRFNDPDVTMILAYDGDKLVGHLEIEMLTAEGYAEVAYFGVLPEARGRGLGRALILHGIEEAFRDDDIELVLARAHDDERAACFALEKLGFKLSHGVVSFTLELA